MLILIPDGASCLATTSTWPPVISPRNAVHSAFPASRVSSGGCAGHVCAVQDGPGECEQATAEGVGLGCFIFGHKICALQGVQEGGTLAFVNVYGTADGRKISLLGSRIRKVEQDTRGLIYRWDLPAVAAGRVSAGHWSPLNP